MSSNVGRAVKYWFKSTVRPGEVVEEFQSDPSKISISFWITLLFALLYTVTAYLLYTHHVLPAIPPWMPIEADRYYLYQVFWTVPWGLGTWVMISGISHLLAIAGRKNVSKYEFEDALAVCCIGWVIPSFYFMWIPETFLVPFFGVFWPFWIEQLRVMIFPTVWQTLLIAIGLKKTHDVTWIRGIGIGLLTVVVFFVMFLAFVR